MRKLLVGCFALLALLNAAGLKAAEKDIVDTAVGAGSFETLVAAVKAAGLVETLKGKGPFTVLAPTDEAFAKLPKGTVETLLKPENKADLVAILTYHVVPGAALAKDVVKATNLKTVNGQRADITMTDGKVLVDGANIIKTDIECSNGVIHVIDSVILPSSDSIPAVADKAKAFKTLLAAAKAAGLVDALSGDGPLTVFAPTDDAFAKLPAGTVESLLKPENKGKLADILKYHVVPGRVYADQALAAQNAKTLLGPAVAINAPNGVAQVNKAKLLKTDIDAKNGVIHVIDSVLLPAEPAKKAAALPAAPAQQVAQPVRYVQQGYVVSQPAAGGCPNSRGAGMRYARR
ncbi:MAG: fasciclin domain-containing protein [Planctomycetaceae bacterium]